MTEERIRLQGTKRELMTLIPQMTAMYQMLEALNLESGGGSVSENYDPGRRFHPIIKLYFREDTDFRPGTNQPKGRGQNRKKGELRFRLMDETTETLTEANLKTLATKIKETFDGYIWRKGKELYCYADWAKGYQLQILARSQAQAEELTTKILSLQGHQPIWKYLTKSQNTREAERYPLTPQKKVILGEEVELPLLRPNVEVRFLYAQVRISPLLKYRTIYDSRKRKVDLFTA